MQRGQTFGWPPCRKPLPPASVPNARSAPGESCGRKHADAVIARARSSDQLNGMRMLLLGHVSEVKQLAASKHARTSLDPAVESDAESDTSGACRACVTSGMDVKRCC